MSNGVDGGFRVTYIGELKQNADALAFIGHAVPANGVAPAQSAGLMFLDADLIKTRSDLTLPWWVGGQTAQWYDAVEGGTRVVFIASCWPGEIFTSLWNLLDRALIVPINPTLTFDLSRGGTAWKSMSTDLAAGCTVDQAVNHWNGDAPGVAYDYRVEGSGGIRLAPLRPGYSCQ